jgi:hypothetical protein
MNSEVSLLGDLERALAGGTDAQRLDMLTRVTDLFLAGASHYSIGQVKLFDEVIARLAATMEPLARSKLAARMAPEPNAPTGVIRQLALDDNIAVARPVLNLSENLSEADLIAAASAKSQQHLVAIAQRSRLNEAVTDVLVTRGNRDVVHSVSSNRGAQFSHSSFRILVKKATDDDTLALQLGERDDLPRQLFLRMVDEASAAVRSRLMAEKVDDAPAIDAAVSEVSGSIRVKTPIATNNYAAISAKLDPLHRAGKLGESEVFGFTRERQVAETVVALSLLAGVEYAVVERALAAPGADMLLILAKLAGLSWPGAKALLLLKAADGTVPDRVLEQARGNFNRLQIGTARSVLGFYQARADALPATA